MKTQHKYKILPILFVFLIIFSGCSTAETTSGTTTATISTVLSSSTTTSASSTASTTTTSTTTVKSTVLQTNAKTKPKTTTTTVSRPPLTLPSDFSVSGDHTVKQIAGLDHIKKMIQQDLKKYSSDAKYFVVMDADSNQVLDSKNKDYRVNPASTTKLMTACVALHYVDPDTVFTVGSELYSMNSNSSICGLSVGNPGVTPPMRSRRTPPALFLRIHR